MSAITSSAAPPALQVESLRYAVASTSHLRLSDNDQLSVLGDGALPVMIASTECGYIVSLCQGGDEITAQGILNEMRAVGLSEDFTRLWLRLREAGFGLVQFDRDADTIQGFPTFDW